MKPDYQGGSIVNLAASIESAFGSASPYASARDLRPDELRAARNVVLLVLDGLGHRLLARAAAGAGLRARQRGVLTSTFPSTTAAAITTFLTGLAPLAHGLTGWHMYFRELGAVLAVLPFRPRHGGPSLAAEGVTPQSLLAPRPLADRLAAPAFMVSPREIAHSDFNVAHAGGAARIAYSGRDELFTALAAVVHGGRGRYVYAYYSELDALAHAHGAASAEVRAEIAALDAAFEAFLASIAGTDTLVIATADHGFVDTRPGSTIDLAQHPELAGMLAVPLCGEPRIAYCYLRPGTAEPFARYVESHLGEMMSVCPAADLIADGWFGTGPVHPRLAGRVGDVVLVMKDGYAIRDELPGEQRRPQIGVHGGISEDEMLVPLVVARA